MRHAFFLIGSPGSGKEGISVVARSNGVQTISTRALLEAHAKKDPLIKSLIDNGIRVQDELIVQLVQTEVRGKGEQPILIDTPRSTFQAEHLWMILSCIRYHITTLHLEITAEEAFKRMVGRDREDDTAEVVQKRIDDYRSYGQSVVETLRESTVFHTIDTMRPESEVRVIADHLIKAELSLTPHLHVPKYLEKNLATHVS